MLDFKHIFRRLHEQVASPLCDYGHVLALETSGVAAKGVASLRTSSSFGNTTAVQVAAGPVVFEGVASPASTGSWEGDEILGDSYGVPLASSGLAEGMRVYLRHPTGEVVAAVSGELVDNGLGYDTGETAEALAPQDTDASVMDIHALSLYARLDPHTLLPPPYSTSYNVFYDHDITLVRLDALYSQINVGDVVAVEAGTSIGAAPVLAAEAGSTTVNGVEVPITVLVLAPPPITPDPLDPFSVRIWFNAKKAGTLERIPTKTVTKDDFLNKACPVTLPPNTTLPAQDTFIVIQDAEGTTLRAKGGGQGSSDNPQIMITELLEEFEGELVKPITFLWGLTKVTCGKTVNREIIGSGDATQRWQSFRLAKSPLTYVADPFAPGGRRPEIDIYVNGIKWRRAQSFYKATPQDEIYVLRHDAEHNTFIQFGDGELGKRLPTGANNVVATYRFGVGGNVEANAINKLVRPIKGVTSVFNPLPATGGEDPPTEAEAREKAIESTRVLGHLVSVVDFEVEAARYGGVVRAKALWGWDQAADDAVVKVWIICADEGDPSADLRTYLMNMAEPEVRVEVSKATKYAGELAIDLDLDPNYLPEDVHAAVDARLFDEFEGLLAPRNVPIGSAFYRSELYAAIHEIEGVRSVLGVLVNGNPMPTRILLEEGQYLALAYPDAG